MVVFIIDLRFKVHRDLVQAYKYSTKKSDQHERVISCG